MTKFVFSSKKKFKMKIKIHATPLHVVPSHNADLSIIKLPALVYHNILDHHLLVDQNVF